MIYIRKKILPFNDTKFNDNNNIFKKQIVQNINYNNDNINSLIKSKSENKFKINNINNIEPIKTYKIKLNKNNSCLNITKLNKKTNIKYSRNQTVQLLPKKNFTYIPKKINNFEHSLFHLNLNKIPKKTIDSTLNNFFDDDINLLDFNELSLNSHYELKDNLYYNNSNTISLSYRKQNNSTFKDNYSNRSTNSLNQTNSTNKNQKIVVKFNLRKKIKEDRLKQKSLKKYSSFNNYKNKIVNKKEIKNKIKCDIPKIKKFNKDKKKKINDEKENINIHNFNDNNNNNNLFIKYRDNSIKKNKLKKKKDENFLFTFKQENTVSTEDTKNLNKKISLFNI